MGNSCADVNVVKVKEKQMLTIKTKKIEKVFNIKVIPFSICLGVDTASRTGWCLIHADPNNVMFDYGTINIKTKDKYEKYDRYINKFIDLLKSNYTVVIEESFYGKNVKTFQLLSRLGGFVYAVCHLIGIVDKRFILATSARKNLSFKGNAKKEIIHKEFIKRLNLKIDDPDIIDAMILALNGIIDEK